MASSTALDRGGRLITLEEFIIDTFTQIGEDGVERPVDRPDELGGGGTYGIIGARMFLPSNRLGMIIDYTLDTLPASMRTALEAYGQDLWVYRERTDGQPTTRSVNRYTKDLRLFDYLSQPRLLSPIDILDTPWCEVHNDGKGITAIHMISGKERLLSFESEMQKIREKVGGSWDPIIVWEPHIYDAHPSSIPLFKQITPLVDIISPNHSEVMSLLSLSLPPSASEQDLKQLLETAALALLLWNPRRGVVIRCGPLGACYVSTGQEKIGWVPAYWSIGAEEEEWENQVVDPTGCGNAFCGAMAAAIDEGKKLRDAVLWGSVAASFVVQQDGLPSLTMAEGKELWNGEDPNRRVSSLWRRVDVCQETDVKLPRTSNQPASDSRVELRRNQ